MRTQPSSLESRTTNAGVQSLLSTHTVLRNTYLLLSLTLLFSGLTAGVAMMTQAAPVGIWTFLLGAFGLMFLTNALRNSVWGLVSIFAFTGFMGYILGPILNAYIHQFTNGGQLIMTALGGTGLTFFGLSGYALASKKNFSSLTQFLVIGGIVLFVGVIASIFLKLTVLQLALSAGIIIFSSLMILWQTSAIIHGGERNYITATISLYMSIFNIFINLLQLLGFVSGQE